MSLEQFSHAYDLFRQVELDETNNRSMRQRTDENQFAKVSVGGDQDSVVRQSGVQQNFIAGPRVDRQR